MLKRFRDYVAYFYRVYAFILHVLNLYNLNLLGRDVKTSGIRSGRLITLNVTC
jgi:hypothetical protein